MMEKYEEISEEEYKVYLGDLLVFATENEGGVIEKIVNNSKCSLVTFNWKGEQLNKDLDCFREFDDNVDVDMDYIENKCKKLKEEEIYVVILINDRDSKFINDKNFGKRLKQLAEELNRIIIVETSLKDENIKEYPVLTDIENQELVSYADIVIFENKSIIAKNNNGKVGIVKFDEEGEDE